MSRWRNIAGVVALCAAALAAPPEPGDLPPEAAEVFAAVRAGDLKELARLASRVDVDRFAVMDDLMDAGQVEAARAYAACAAGAIDRPLAGLSRDVGDGDARGAFRRALELVRQGSAWHALAPLSPPAPAAPAGSILRVRMCVLKARILQSLDRTNAALGAFAEAAESARALGRDLDAEWAEAVAAFEAASRPSDVRLLDRLADRLFELAGLRGDLYGMAAADAERAETSGRLGAFDRAFEHARRARRIFATTAEFGDTEADRAGARLMLASLDEALSRVHEQRGDLPAALAAAEAAVRAFTAEKAGPETGGALLQLGNSHAAYGGYEKALDCYRRAGRVLAAGPDAPSRRMDLLRCRLNEGHALQELGRSEEARKVLGEVLGALGGREAGEETAIALLNLGEALEKQGDFDGARSAYERAIGLCAEDPRLSAWGRVRLGDALSRRGAATDAATLAAAEEAYRRAALDLKGASEPALEILLRLGSGEVALRQGRPADALALAREAVALFDGLTEGLADGEAVEARGHADRSRLFALGIRAADAMGDFAGLFAMLEASRARAFLAALGGRRTLLERFLSAPTAKAMRDALAAVNEAAARLREARAGNRLSEIRDAAAALDAAHEALRTAVAAAEREAKAAGRRDWPAEESLDGIVARLPPERALVLYALLPEGSIALVLSAGGARVARLAPASVLISAASNLHADDRSRAPEEIEREISVLRDLLVKPLALSPGTTSVLVSPDGVLAHLPWPAILSPATEVALVPSAGTLAALSRRRGAPGRGRIALGDPDYGAAGASAAVVYGGGRLVPLAGSRREVDAVCREGDLRLLGADATEGRLRAALPERPRWEAVHLACHGIVNQGRPWLSALALAPAPGDDGFLTALDVYGMTVNADLVVLSGCRTGADPSATGEGIQGLVRAFLLAGADRVVCSLWRAEDEATADLMARFYAERARPGVSAARALSAAAAAIAGRYPHPADRLAFVLWGLPD